MKPFTKLERLAVWRLFEGESIMPSNELEWAERKVEAQLTRAYEDARMAQDVAILSMRGPRTPSEYGEASLRTLRRRAHGAAKRYETWCAIWKKLREHGLPEPYRGGGWATHVGEVQQRLRAALSGGWTSPGDSSDRGAT